MVLKELTIMPDEAEEAGTAPKIHVEVGVTKSSSPTTGGESRPETVVAGMLDFVRALRVKPMPADQRRRERLEDDCRHALRARR